MTPLAFASFRGYLQLVKVSQALQVHRQKSWRFLLLFCTVLTDKKTQQEPTHDCFVKILLENGANVDAARDQDGMTALLWACEEGYLEIVKVAV